jgi:hypothetical protein
MTKARRRRGNGRPRTLKRKGRAQKHPARAQPMDQSARQLFAITIDPATAEIVKLESLTPSGQRRALSDDEKLKLVRATNGGEIEDVVEQMFEAGIACVLGKDDSDSIEESEEDAQLRHLLLTPLIEGSGAGRLMRREVLGRVILGTLISNAIRSGEGVSPAR